MPQPNPYEFNYHSSLFDLSVKLHFHYTHIQMQLHSPLVNTRYLPQTLQLLEKELPSVLTTECFNEKKMSFAKEVVQTEIGHLFEHLILENLYMFAKTNRKSQLEFNGITSWNWETEPWGLFHVKIDAGYKNILNFKSALTQSVFLTEKIMHSPFSYSTN